MGNLLVPALEDAAVVRGGQRRRIHPAHLPRLRDLFCVSGVPLSSELGTYKTVKARFKA